MKMMNPNGRSLMRASGDCPSDRDKLAFSVFAYIAGCDRKWPHFWTTGKSPGVSYVYEHKQSGEDRIGESPRHANLLPRRKAEVVGGADIDSAGAILNRKALIKCARAEQSGSNCNRTFDGHNSSPAVDCALRRSRLS